ncbi:hypothetical protein AVEN_112199-1 [Araneus ventricosus]|uniref:Uncharacterized protein n=1 Tax=Araneus ventricosus TaxID=182803 RepID=A0A4Y2W1T7_ARAVE|nr:hypothetical protein AVEN_112199-1 [Araneus ventricosus]
MKSRKKFKINRIRIEATDVLAKSIFSCRSRTGLVVSTFVYKSVGREFYPGLCSYSVFAIICNEFARQACGKLAASSFHGDFEAFVNLLQACTLVMTNLWQACCKLKLLSGMERTCSKLATSLSYKLIANYSKNRVRTQPGIELATFRLVDRRRYHSTSSATIGVLEI